MSSFFNYTFCLPLDSSFRLLSSLAGLSSSPSPQSPLSFLFGGSGSGFFLFFFLVFANFFFLIFGFFFACIFALFFFYFFCFFFLVLLRLFLMGFGHVGGVLGLWLCGGFHGFDGGCGYVVAVE